MKLDSARYHHIPARRAYHNYNINCDDGHDVQLHYAPTESGWLARR